MPSSFSTNLRIELIALGEQAGTWGTTTNTNLGTALEQAVVGLGNPDFVADANLTITLTNSNAAQAARALVLNVTSSFGSLTTTRELVVPTIQKQYIVQNNTTGSQSITVKTSAGTGITVPNGRKAHLYVDGTNVVQMFDFVDINAGTIDGTTIGASTASTGAFTTLAYTGTLTGGTGVINIGSGQLVKDASGNLLVGTATTSTLSGYTVVGQFKNSIGIVSGSADEFSGALLRESSGSNSISLNADPGNLRAGSFLGFGVDGSERLRITDAGNVGIGTSSPSDIVTLAGGASGSYGLTINNAKEGGGTKAVFQFDRDNGVAVVGANTTNGLVFKTLTGGTLTEHARIDSSGNLLVGTTSNALGFKLYVNGGNDRGMQLDAPSGSGVYTTMNFAQNGAIQAQLFWYSTTDEFIIQNTSAGVKLTNGATSWASASDERLKDIIEPITNAAEKVSSLRAVIGKYKTDADGKRRTFLIAQDVQTVLPEAVYSAQQARSEDETEYLHLQYTDTIPLLVAAIKEQQAIITSLTARVEALEGTQP
jgi:hypothetical protein